MCLGINDLMNDQKQTNIIKAEDQSEKIFGISFTTLKLGISGYIK